jgi:FAD/FMN-containing dehydrogenase
MTTPLAAVPRELEGKVVTPKDRRYAMLRSTYARVSAPAAVLLPENAAQVSAAVRFARGQGLPLAVRSGGHGLSGRSSNDGGIVIDLSVMDRVEVLDRARRIVRVETGARWAQVARALSPHGLLISSGDHGNVGVGGLSTAGGVGWLVRQYGLTIDHIRAAEVVLADGTLLRADAEHEPELLWAVRGAGSGVGVVVALEIEAMERAEVAFAQIVLAADPAGRTLRRWAEYMRSAPRELTTAMTLLAHGSQPVLQLHAVIAADNERRIRRAAEPLLGIGTKLLGQSVQVVPYQALVPTAHVHANTGQQPVMTTNGLLPAMTPDAARAIMTLVTGPAPLLVQLRSLGGAVADVPEQETAFAHRHQQALVIATEFTQGKHPVLLDAAWPRVARHLDGQYLGFESRPDAAAFERVYPGATGQRVHAAWRRYDPEGLFRSTLFGPLTAPGKGAAPERCPEPA